MIKQVRQGDVLLLRVIDLPSQSVRVESGSKVVLAEGEATGHAHVVDAAHATLFSHGNENYLDVEEETSLTHEEHAPIKLSPGLYRVIRQREYIPVGPRVIPVKD